MYRYSGFGVVRSHDYLRFGSPRIRPGEEGSNGLQVRIQCAVAERHRSEWQLDNAGSERGANREYHTNPRFYGRYINFTYTNGLITQATDALTLQYGVSRTISYGYDRSGRLVTITDPNYKTTTIGYSTVSGQIDNITSIKDANLNATTIGYTTTGGSGQPPIGSLSSIGLPTARRGDFLIRRIPTATSPAPTSPTVLAPSGRCFSMAQVTSSATPWARIRERWRRQQPTPETPVTTLSPDQYNQNVLIPPVTGTYRHTIFAYDTLGKFAQRYARSWRASAPAGDYQLHL